MRLAPVFALEVLQRPFSICAYHLGSVGRGGGLQLLTGRRWLKLRQRQRRYVVARGSRDSGRFLVRITLVCLTATNMQLLLALAGV